MPDPTRKDAGLIAAKLFVTIELDPSTMLATVETNIVDAAAMIRVVGQGMHIWSDNLMRKRVAATMSGTPSRKLILTPKHGGN